METQRDGKITISFYFTATGLFFFAIYKDWDIFLNDRHLEIGITSQRSFGWRLKYLTFINLVRIFRLKLFLATEINLLTPLLKSEWILFV